MTTGPSPETQKPKRKENKIVSLKVNNTKKLKKQEQEDKKFFRDCMNNLIKDKPNPQGWACISWDEESYSVTYLVDDDQKLYYMPEMVKNILTKDIKENFL